MTEPEEKKDPATQIDAAPQAPAASIENDRTPETEAITPSQELASAISP